MTSHKVALSDIMRTTANTNELIKGNVSIIESRLDPISRAVIVRATIENRDGRLKPGMLMTVKLMRAEAPALLIPEQALVPEGDRKFVFAVREDKAVKLEVQTGRRRPGAVEITHGVSDGDVVVIEGTQKVRDGAPVKVIANETAANTATRADAALLSARVHA